MFDIRKFFRRSNTQMLQSAINKSMLLGFNKSEKVLHDKMFKKKSILMVDEEETSREVPEPGQPDPRVSHIKVRHNKTTDESYMFFDKEWFEDMEQEQIDNMIYQLFNQGEFDNTVQYAIDIPEEDGTISVANVDVESSDFTEKEEEEAKEKSKSSGSCSTEEGAKSASETTKKSKKYTKQAEVKISESEKMKNPKYTSANANFQKGKTSKNAQIFKGYSEKSTNTKKINNSDLKEIALTQAILEHAIKGEDGGKDKSITPSKRLNMRAIITESSDNEYITHHGDEGKDIKINIVVDRSGSMGGRPTKESNILIAALNNLAFEYDELDIEIMLSTTGSYYTFPLPVDNVNSEELWVFDGTGDAEGLSRTIAKNWDRIKEGDVNLCYTDGSIYDEALDKAKMKSQEVEFVGMYVNKEFSPEDVMKHYEKNKKYFTHTIIRKDMKALVNELANRIFLSKDGR